MIFRIILFFFLPFGLTLNAFGAMNSENTKTQVNTSSESEELIEEFENALINDEMALAFNQTGTGTTEVGKTRSSDNFEKISDLDEGPKNYYLSINGGVLNFPYVGNIQTLNGAGGFGLGAFLNPNLKIEASFIYSFQQTEIDRFFETVFNDVDQYSFNATGAYHWNVSWPVIPITGVAASLTHRRYNYDENRSNAFDVGLVLGADKPVSPGFSFGLEYRYMINVDYDRDFGNSGYSTIFQSMITGSEVDDLESFNYQVVLLNAKFKF